MTEFSTLYLSTKRWARDVPKCMLMHTVSYNIRSIWPNSPPSTSSTKRWARDVPKRMLVLYETSRYSLHSTLSTKRWARDVPKRRCILYETVSIYHFRLAALYCILSTKNGLGIFRNARTRVFLEHFKCLLQNINNVLNSFETKRSAGFFWHVCLTFFRQICQETDLRLFILLDERFYFELFSY